MPKHEVLDESETKRLLETYNITKNELPKIKKTDPAIKKLDAKVGDVIKITRDSFTVTEGGAVYYRVVIP